ncbi:sensor histidine kinase [Paenibacillus methanolicus]|uniref:histidine kinase n=1 Tax=Paenibacillus methanolicus TaxID=582686 RepID=A0A5S5CH85_9BACL|nr:sensor histidine kinase [Paenibacillus methanolicus]TYP79130.1 histidine kinase/DNA gyrase B/HSP90-like ATPase [Paenibacillus methanolicus]
MRKRRRWIPNTLNNRLFAAFIVMVLVPYAILSAYNFSEVEKVMRNKIGEQDQEHLEAVKRSLENVMGIVMKTVTLIGQDPTVLAVLRYPDQYGELERQRKMENRLQSVDNSFFLTGTQVYFTVADLTRNVYTSFRPEDRLDYRKIADESWFQAARSGEAAYQWNSSEPSYVSKDISRSPYLISLYVAFKDENLRTIGVARVSIDYLPWFKTITSTDLSGQRYFIVNREGAVIQRSDSESELPPAVAVGIAAKQDEESVAMLDDRQSLYTSSYLPALQWTIVKQVPLGVLYREVEEQKRRYYTSFVVFSLAFLLAGFAITRAMTRPLKLLQRRMEGAAANDLKLKLPEERGSVEIVALSRSFNRMIRDMNGLIDRLRLEERQRQAVRFQVLLSQMDPHFLLNTLHSIKCIALRNDDDEIHEMCISLGKLLESSLDLDRDLIHLKDELALLDAYMHIHNSRFGHRFSIAYEWREELDYALVPKSTLQPLVENAIVHGFAAREEGRIVVRGYRDRDRLVLEVEDDGAGIQEERTSARKRKGIGIRNVRERLELLFPGRASLELFGSEQGTRACVTLPLLVSAPYGMERGKDHVDVAHRGR